MTGQAPGLDPAAAPRVLDVRTGLRATLGETRSEDVWSSVCAALGVPTDVQDLDPALFDELLHLLAQHDRMCHVLARSWRIRSTSAVKLAEIGR